MSNAFLGQHLTAIAQYIHSLEDYPLEPGPAIVFFGVTYDVNNLSENALAIIQVINEYQNRDWSAYEIKDQKHITKIMDIAVQLWGLDAVRDYVVQNLI